MATDKNLCNSCTNFGCEFQSGIVRTECAFYMPPHIAQDYKRHMKKAIMMPCKDGQKVRKVMNDEIKNTFKSSKTDSLKDSMDFTYEIRRQVREDEDNFIFETIQPYCSNIAQQKISKKDINEMVQLWMAAKRIMHVEDKP